MATTALTASTFESTILDNDIVFVDFWAAWCGPCRAFAPVYDKASEQHEGVVFGKVDTDAEPALSQALKIQSIPTIMAFREGILVFSQPGAMRGPDFEQLVEQVKGLDMEQVRQAVKEHEANQGGSPA